MKKIILLFAGLLFLISCEGEGVQQPDLISVDYIREKIKIKKNFVDDYDATNSSNLDYLASTYAQLLCEDEEMYLNPTWVYNTINYYGKHGYKPLRYIIKFVRSEKVVTKDTVELINSEDFYYTFFNSNGQSPYTEYGIGWGEVNGYFCIGAIVVIWGI